MRSSSKQENFPDTWCCGMKKTFDRPQDFWTSFEASRGFTPCCVYLSKSGSPISEGYKDTAWNPPAD